MNRTSAQHNAPLVPAEELGRHQNTTTGNHIPAEDLPQHRNPTTASTNPYDNSSGMNANSTHGNVPGGGPPHYGDTQHSMNDTPTGKGMNNNTGTTAPLPPLSAQHNASHIPAEQLPQHQNTHSTTANDHTTSTAGMGMKDHNSGIHGNAAGPPPPSYSTSTGTQSVHGTSGNETGLGRIKSLANKTHGVGEMLRGNLMSAADEMTGNREAAERHKLVAQGGEREILSGKRERPL